MFSAGRIHGVGIRDRIYWSWFQKQESMAQLMEVIERTGTGFTIYYYPVGNTHAKAEVRELAERQTRTNVVLMPRFSPWKRGEFTVVGLTGVHATDQPRMRREFAIKNGWFTRNGKPDEARVSEYLRTADDGYGGKGLRLHHAGHDTVQLIPADLHKIQHTDVSHPFGE